MVDMTRAGGVTGPRTADGTVLVTIDSLRADALSGPDVRRRAPVVSSLAADATVFENAFAHGNWTPFSFPSILASKPVFTADAGIGVREATTLASALSAAGVETAGFNAANGFLTGHWGYDAGFDRFESFVEADTGKVGRFLAAHPTVQGWLDLLRARPMALRGSGGDGPALDASRLGAVEGRARSFLREVEGPFFLWVHYMDTHTPYVPDAVHRAAVSEGSMSRTRMLRAHVRAGLGASVGESTCADLRRLYDAALHQVDASIGRLLDTLAAEGLRESTCVVVAGDHGEEFMDHGHLAHYPKLYDELVHVPLVVDHPDGASRRVHEPVGLADVAPTVCEVMSVPDERFEGRSRLPAVSGRGERPSPAAGSSADPDPVVSVAVRGDSVTEQPIPRSLADGELLVSARTADWTYIRHTETGREAVYDRREPGSERDDRLEDVAPATVEPLVAAVTEREERLTAATAEQSADGPPDAVADRLSALGYR